MDGHDDFADWSGTYREPRGGRDERRGPAPSAYGSDERYAYEDEPPRVPGPRAPEGRPDARPDGRYSSLADLSAGYGPAGGPGSPAGGPGSPVGGRVDLPGERPGDWRGDRYSAAPPQRGPRPGEPMPALEAPFDPAFDPPYQPGPPPMQTEPIRQHTENIDVAAVRRSLSESDGVYRSKRPALGALFGVVAGLGELLMLRPLLAGAFGITAGPALAPLLAMVAFPMLALGLYALTTGAATAVAFQGPRVWLRTPLVYLVVGVALLLAAGAAA